MPIEAPDLDDLRYERLRELLLARIDVVAPEWTDHNASDPGIALLELFSWMGEQLGYRLNQVPDRNYLAFLELLGTQLKPAEAATSRVALILTAPESVPYRFRVPAGTTVEADTEAAQVFEVDQELDAVPAQPACVITTLSTDLRDLADATDPLGDDDDPEAWLQDRLAVVWDGASPKPQDMPNQPVVVGQANADATHQMLWIGLVFNPAPPAGFLGNRVTLTVQLDDDEQPDVYDAVTCDNQVVSDANARSTYTWYRPAQPGESEGSWRALSPLSDTTEGWSRSGEIRFDVPKRMGPIPDAEWKALRGAPGLTMEEICAAATATPSASVPESVDHPLPGSVQVNVSGLALSVPISGWIGVRVPAGTVPAIEIRQLSFNVAAVTHARTVSDELLGSGDGRPGQTFQLANGDVLDGTLELAVEDRVAGLLHDYTRVPDLDGSGPDARVYTLDPESGAVQFGDGARGRPPQPRDRVVALRYRHGGGAGNDLAPGTITGSGSMPSQVTAVTNIVSALGGKDAETLDQAKARVPRSLKVRERAVTASDFQFLTLQTPGLTVGRAEIVPLRRPFADPDLSGPGLDLGPTAPGAVSVVVVPQQETLFPRPTAGELRTVCAWLDQHRLVTTEVHVVPPMYVRLYDLDLQVVAHAGYSTALLRETIAADLEAWLHPLTGGDDGQGWVFGSELSHSALVARLFGIDGVARVERLSAWFDSNAPSEGGDPGPQIGRSARLVPKQLTDCPEGSTQTGRLQLLADEVVFVDTASMNVSVVYA